jgi:hypothetical protein
MEPLSAGGTKCCLHSIGRTASITEECGTDHLSSQHPVWIHYLEPGKLFLQMTFSRVTTTRTYNLGLMY